MRSRVKSVLLLFWRCCPILESPASFPFYSQCHHQKVMELLQCEFFHLQNRDGNGAYLIELLRARKGNTYKCIAVYLPQNKNSSVLTVGTSFKYWLIESLHWHRFKKKLQQHQNNSHCLQCTFFTFVKSFKLKMHKKSKKSNNFHYPKLATYNWTHLKRQLLSMWQAVKWHLVAHSFLLHSFRKLLL